ncbi:VanZ family protein [uncultured Tyzzerella sp.]|uniref:VanZ family protein n=1 Tax=uncultured Tyzzerella sp. TaxID=2321398 RepID=UPI002942A60D|nr:VanZ family protein [uncultured Tyzzerella sp.]
MQIHFKKSIYLAITILIISFVFYNSMQNGESSSNTSTAVLMFVNNLINTIGLNFQVSGHFIRKLAHFIEFFALGIFLMLTFEAFTNRLFSIIGFPMFFSIFIPVIDEFIQIYSPGRASSVKDVLLDFSGAILGVLLVFTSFIIKNKNRLNN